MSRLAHTPCLFLCVALVGLQGGFALDQPARKSFHIENARVRVTVEWQGDRYGETYAAKNGKSWKPLLVSGSVRRPDPAWNRDGVLPGAGFQECVQSRDIEGNPALILTLKDEAGVLEKEIRLVPQIAAAHVAVRMKASRQSQLGYLLSTYRFLPKSKTAGWKGAPEFIFTPQLRPEEHDVIGDHVFRAPALMMQEGRSFVGLVPDLLSIDGENRAARAGADLQVDTLDAPFVSFGFLPWVKRAHVYYAHIDTTTVRLEAGTYSYAFFLVVNAAAPPRLGYQDVVRFQWETYGRENLVKAKGPQAEPFAHYIQKAWYQYLPQVAMDADCGGTPVTLLRQHRLAWSNKMHAAADNDCWFNVWFNALRTAYGIYWYGKAAGDTTLVRQSLGVLSLALCAPQREGIAPSIFYVDSAGGHWVNDHAWGGIGRGEYYAMFHNAWTCTWLLRWAGLVPERRDDILRYTRNFAEFLVRHQRDTGVIPSWYHPTTMEPAPELRDENAETAGAALFLAEFALHTGEKRYRAAAEHAMRYVFTSIVPEHKWFDYETFFSCSRKPLGFFDAYTHQHPQNTLGMHQAAEACEALFRLTGNPLYREKGCEILDYLSLYQQVWSPRWLSCELFGGFGVQNTDGEWSDSRQGYFAETYVKYYELTGRREYFERGVAALRAMFSLFESPESPRTAENYAHAAADKLAGVTGLHWGTGSSVVSMHLLSPRYGDAYVNVKEQWGLGIDGCRIPSVEVHGTTITVSVLDNVTTPRTVRLVFDRMNQKNYTVVVNGKQLGRRSLQQLREGLHIAL